MNRKRKQEKLDALKKTAVGARALVDVTAEVTRAVWWRRECQNDMLYTNGASCPLITAYTCKCATNHFEVL